MILRFFISASALLMFAGDLAFAKCVHDRIPWRYGRDIESTWVTDGAVCKSTNKRPRHVKSMAIVFRPSHGIAGKDGPFGVAYKPNPGFKGTDSFIYEVTSNESYRKGPDLIARVKVRVVVK